LQYVVQGHLLGPEGKPVPIDPQIKGACIRAQQQDAANHYHPYEASCFEQGRFEKKGGFELFMRVSYPTGVLFKIQVLDNGITQGCPCQVRGAAPDDDKKTIFIMLIVNSNG